MACGQMGLTISYLYTLTVRQFFNIQKGWSDRRDTESKERMLLTRKLMHASLSPWSKNITEQGIWLMPWENDTPEERTEAEEIELQAELEASKKRWEKRDAFLNQSKMDVKTTS